MTTTVQNKVKCSVCRRKSSHTSVVSTNSFGSPDLDTRPPEMQRSTMQYWIERCPNCGYCTTDLSKSSVTVKKIIKNKEYINQLNNKRFPSLANSFLCYSIIQQSEKDFNGATWSVIHAAWVCDDAFRDEEAVFCRKLAIELLNLAEQISEGEVIDNAEKESNFVLKIDLMRRARDFGNAQELLSANMEKLINDNVKNVLEYQIFLINKNDDMVYTLEEAFDWKNPNSILLNL